MYDFWYNHIKCKYRDRIKLYYINTDSLIIEIETKDIYTNMIEDMNLYDFNNFSKEHPLFEKLLAD